MRSLVGRSMRYLEGTFRSKFQTLLCCDLLSFATKATKSNQPVLAFLPNCYIFSDMELSPGMIRYSVIATLANKDVLEEYTSWLRNGHIKKIVDDGGALQGDFSVLQSESDTQVVSSFIFPNKASYEAYATGLAVELRPEGVALFVNTGKVVKFERMITEIKHTYRNTVEYALAEVNAYLFFNGNCREAMEFYKSCFAGSSLDIMTYEASPNASTMSAEARNTIMHSWLTLSAKAKLMASDVPAGDPAVTFGNNIALCVNACSVEEITAIYEKLCDSATILLPLEDQFWGGKFAQLVDKFGVLWMLHLHLSESCKLDALELVPYLQFNGDCRAVINDVKNVLGGSLNMMTYDMAPMKDTFSKDILHHILHSRLSFNNETCYMMGSDVTAPLPSVSKGTNVSLSLLFKHNDKIQMTYDALGRGGKVLEALENQFWGGLFGHVEDKYGFRWMVVGPHPDSNCADDAPAASPESKKSRNE